MSEQPDCGYYLASMRPAREGRENQIEADRRRRQAKASMRPAREGRENILAAFGPQIVNGLLQ